MMHSRIVLLASLITLFSGLASAQADGRPAKATFRAKVSRGPDARQIPPTAMLRLFAAFPAGLLTDNQRELHAILRDRYRRKADGSLEVDSNGGGARWTAVKPDKVAHLEVFHGGRKVPLQFFRLANEWWAASSRVLHAGRGDATLRLYDGNGDGDFLDAADYVSWKHGAFRMLADQHVVGDGKHMFRIRLLPRGRAVALEMQPTNPRPKWASDDQWQVLSTLNALRNQQGLSPGTLDKGLCDGLTKHTQFLQRHEPMVNKGNLKSYMGEDSSKAGYSKEGHESSMRGNVAFLLEGHTPASHTSSILGMTHSRIELVRAGMTRVGYGRTASWSFLRCEDGEGTRPQEPVLIPAAGATDVPLQCGSNHPPPRSMPKLYKGKRGCPISIYLPRVASGDSADVRVESMALFQKASMTEVAGFFFSIKDIFPSSTAHTFFFVAADSLQATTDYVVRTTVSSTIRKGGGEGIRSNARVLVWQFRTGH